MRDLARYGTSDWPLHPSGLKTLLTCPWNSVLRYLVQPDDEGGVAGDTGSACHIAVREFHRGKELAECITVMNAELPKYPHADLIDAAGMFLKYASDIRNSQAKVVLTEATIAFQIEPAPQDKTQEKIEVVGTVDQVREIDGRYYVYDLKTSKKDPLETLHKHTTQVAAYCIGASIKLGKPVHGAALIFPRRYRADVNTSPVFWHYPWGWKDIAHILDGVRHVVASIRNGDVWHIPGELCTWCHAKSPDLCLPKLQELKLRTKT